ncbi:MAG: hypothetical protein AAFX01_02335 [Cyanobacteria bacterium J06638_28]
MILCLYGTAQTIHQNEAAWEELFPLFSPLPDASQIFKLSVELVQTSCGMGVLLFDYVEERNQLDQ